MSPTKCKIRFSSFPDSPAWERTAGPVLGLPTSPGFPRIRFSTCANVTGKAWSPERNTSTEVSSCQGPHPRRTTPRAPGCHLPRPAGPNVRRRGSRFGFRSFRFAGKFFRDRILPIRKIRSPWSKPSKTSCKDFTARPTWRGSASSTIRTCCKKNRRLKRLTRLKRFKRLKILWRLLYL